MVRGGWRALRSAGLVAVVVLGSSAVGALAPARGAGRTPAVLRIYLARHGQTDWNAAHRLQGWTDTHLDSTGRAQAAKTAERLRGVRFDHVYCSTLARSRETAMILHGDAPIDSLPGLREQHLGKFEGLVTTGPDTVAIAEYRRRTALPDDSLDGGESLNQHFENVRAVIEMIRRRHPSGNVLIVGHGGTNRQVLHALLGISNERMFEINQGNDELYLIELEEGVAPRLWKLIPETNLKEL